jgi:hypothetical protein
MNLLREKSLTISLSTARCDGTAFLPSLFLTLLLFPLAFIRQPAKWLDKFVISGVKVAVLGEPEVMLRENKQRIWDIRQVKQSASLCCVRMTHAHTFVTPQFYQATAVA